MFFLITGVGAGILIVLFAGLTWIVSRLLKRRWGRRIVRFSLYSFLGIWPVVTFLLIPFLFALLISGAGTRPQDVRLKLDPGEFGCHFEEVVFKSGDGIDLAGWWMEGDPEKTALVIAHGLFRDRKEVTGRGCRFRQLGHSVLVYDLRGHGKSGPGPITMGYQERFDVLGAVRFVRENQSSALAVMGISMGAAASLMAVSEMTEAPMAIIADSSFASLRDTVRRHARLFVGIPGFPFADVFVWQLTRLGGFSADAFDLPLVFKKSENWPPTLLIYGSEDERMPAETARSLFQALPTPHKKLVFFEQANHGDAWEADADRYLSTITNFLQEQGGTAVNDSAVLDSDSGMGKNQ
jgi:alpha-beta hydrolase superfamily lysophospholipase